MFKKVVITGANGFIGKNLKVRLSEYESLDLKEITRSTKPEHYGELLQNADIVFHLAGVNRPENIKKYYEGNTEVTRRLLEALPSDGCKLVFSSSIHVNGESAYGDSKRLAEEAITAKTEEGKLEAFIYRLPGVFGKWSKPNYNSVVATFCHNIAHDEEISIDTPDAKIDLVYIDDVIAEFIDIMDKQPVNGILHYESIEPIYTVTVNELAEKIKSYRSYRSNLHLPPVNDDFEKKLYSTFLSYLPKDKFSYPLYSNRDERGSLFEWIKSESFGQIFVSSTKPGVTRGNHYHHTKTEKFLVIQGQAKIQFRQIDGDGKIIEYTVSGSRPEVVDIPPGYTHNLTNIGDQDMITLFWANEIFDEDNPDTIYEDV